MERIRYTKCGIPKLKLKNIPKEKKNVKSYILINSKKYYLLINLKKKYNGYGKYGIKNLKSKNKLNIKLFLGIELVNDKTYQRFKSTMKYILNRDKILNKNKQKSEE